MKNVGASLWTYVAQDDTLGPTWVLRVTFVPVAAIPWQKKVQREMAAAATAEMSRPPRF
jgi:hypothetical protein